MASHDSSFVASAGPHAIGITKAPPGRRQPLRLTPTSTQKTATPSFGPSPAIPRPHSAVAPSVASSSDQYPSLSAFLRIPREHHSPTCKKLTNPPPSRLHKPRQTSSRAHQRQRHANPTTPRQLPHQFRRRTASAPTVGSRARWAWTKRDELEGESLLSGI